MNAEYYLTHDEYLNVHYTFDNEVWDDLKGFDDYKISNCFRVKNRKKNFILKPQSCKGWLGGYFFMFVTNKNKRKRVYATDLFDNFDYMPRNMSEFIYNMY